MGSEGPETTLCGPEGVQREREAKDASPLREWAADRGPPNFGEGAQVGAGCQAPGALLAACVPRPPLTFVKKAHPLPGPASAPFPHPEPLPPTL